MKFDFEKLIHPDNVDDTTVKQLLHSFYEFAQDELLEDVYTISNITQYLKWITDVLYQTDKDCDDIVSIYNNLDISPVDNTLTEEFVKLILKVENRADYTINYIKFTGYQDSYSDSPPDFDREIEEVFSKQILKTVFVNSKGEE
jgi:hypothetical protein